MARQGELSDSGGVMTTPSVCEMFKKLTYDSSTSDLLLSKESVELFNMYSESADHDTVYQVKEDPEGESFDKIYTTIQQNLTTIAELEELSGIAPRHVTLRHIQDVLDISDYYRNFNYLHVGQKVPLSANIFLGPKTSLFEFLLDLLAALQTCPSISIHVHASRKPTALVICKEIVSPDNECPLEWNLKETRTLYCTLFVTEDCDLESAADVLAESTGDNISMWKIRHVLVQESVLSRFNQLVSSRLRPFPEVLLRNDTFVTEFNDGSSIAQDMGLDCISNASIPSSVRPTLVLGGARSHFDRDGLLAPLITINVFRTIKEGITAFNSAHGGSISIWSAGISAAYEVAHSVKASTVWINCFAKFNQTVPFSFQPGGFNYGGDLGILDRFIKVRTAQVTAGKDAKPHKIAELCTNVISKLRAKYVNVAVDKHHHFECLSSPLDLSDFHLFADEEKVYSESLQMIFKPNIILQIGAEVGSNKLANTVFNRRKTTVFAFGETFAN